MNNKDLLKAIGDIDDRYLSEINDLEENQNKSRIEVINMKKRILKYVLASVCVIMIALIGISKSNLFNLKNNTTNNIKEWKIKEVYIDAGIDEFAKDKPAYKKMIQDIIEKKINLIVTANLLRIARNKNELIEIVNLQNELGFRTLLSDSREEIQINNVNTDGISEFIEENDIEF